MIATRRRGLAALGLIAMVGLIAASCSSPQAAAPTPDPAAQMGGSITVSIPPITTVDPADAASWSEVVVARAMCDTLIDVDPVTGELVPGLARSWLVSDDGQRLTLQLRDGLTFADGSPLTSTEVAASLTRLASPDTASRVADLLSAIDGYDELRGRTETRDAADRERLRGVRLPTRLSVELLLTDLRADLLAVLTHPATAPVSSVAVAADPTGFRQQPVCAGPYALTEPWTGGERLDLTRVPHHGGQAAATNGGSGYVDHLRIRFDGTTNADLALRPAVPASLQPGTEVVLQPGPGMDYIGVATATGGDDPVAQAAAESAVRRALSLVLDRTALADRVFGGTRLPARHVVPSSLGTANLGDDGSCPGVPARADVDQARALLQTSQTDLGAAAIELLSSDDFRNTELAEAVAAQWRDVLGLTVEVRSLPFADFVAATTGTTPDLDAVRTSWSSSIPSVDAYLHPLFHASQWGRGNLTQFSDPVLDDLLTDQARRAEDPEDRVLLYQQALASVCASLPLIPIVEQQFVYVVRTARIGSASGEVAGGLQGAPYLRELFVR